MGGSGVLSQGFLCCTMIIQRGQKELCYDDNTRTLSECHRDGNQLSE
jgi:hypothetical protein